MAAAITLTKNQQNMAAGAIVAVVVLFLLIWKVYIPMGKQVVELENKKTSLEQEIASLKQKAMQRDKLQAEIQLLTLEKEELQKQLPQTTKMDDLLRLITDKAQKIGIFIQQFSPSPRVSKNYYVEIPVMLQVQGTYHTLANFLSDICQSERIISAQDLKISKGSGQDSYTISTNFSLVTYMSQ